MNNKNSPNQYRTISYRLQKLLSEMNRFEYVEEEIRNVITCHFNNNSLLSVYSDEPDFKCSFDIYSDHVLFFLYYNYGKGQEQQEQRFISELLVLEGIDIYPGLMCLTFLNKSDMEMLKKTNSKNKDRILRLKTDLFFEKYADKIIRKIWEIQLNVVL